MRFGTSASIAKRKSIDILPGDYEMNQEEIKRWATPVDLFEEKYKIAKQFDPSSSMMKMNAFGVPVIVLFSHDLVKQWQQYELKGQTRRPNVPIFEKLVGNNFADLYGAKHLEWRKKTAKSFKPHIIDQYTPFIQKAASDIVLQGISNTSKESGEYVYFCQEAKRFAFEIGIKFVMGPLINAEERDHLFSIFQRFTATFSPKVMEDPEGKDPDSVLSKGIKASEELRAWLEPKYFEAEKLLKGNEWDKKYKDSECLLKGLLENDAMIVAGKEFSMEDKLNILIILTFAAYDTSATSLNNLVYTMYKNPKETEILRNAIMNHPELSNPDTVFTMEMLQGCNELDFFIQESQRHEGIVPASIRQVNDENGLEFGNYLLPKETNILIPIKWLHHGEGSWTDSMEFKPSRFDKSNGSSKQERGDIGRYNNVPFMTGLHKCLGMHLALLEMRIYTVLLLRDWEFELDENRLMEDNDGIINGMNMDQGIAHWIGNLNWMKID